MESRTQERGAAWLDVRGAAAHLACSTKRIYDLVAQGRVRFARDGRRLLFRVEWLDAMVMDAEHGA
jgi:excisionase family DNA binding protein